MAVFLLAEEDTNKHSRQKKNIIDGLPGSDVYFATSNQQTIEFIGSTNPDVILVGNLGTEDNRLDLCRQLKNNQNTREIPVIFLTNSILEKKIAQKAFDSGADAFIQLPATKNELKALVKNSGEQKLLSIAANAEPEQSGEEDIKNLASAETIHKHENLYQSLMNHLPQRIFIKDRNLVYISCSIDFASDFGTTPDQIIGKDDFALFPPSQATEFQNDDQKVIDSGKIKDIVEPYSLNGKAYWAHTIKVPYRNKENKIIGVLGIYEDITERIRIDEQIRQNEEHYRLLFDNMVNGIMVCEVITDESGEAVDHVFVNGNLAFEKLTGVNSAEQAGKTSTEMSISWPPEIRKKLYSVAMTGVPIEYERFNESLQRYYETRVFSPRKGQFAHVFTDITDRKSGEIKLANFNRLYSVISQVNQAIVHLYDLDSFIQEVCRITVENGKFRMAWIGFADEIDEVIKPKAFAGFEDDYLKVITPISIRNLPEGQGPTGRALQEGRHFVCADFETDPTVSLWREEALKRNYHSSIALPIKKFGKVTGAFTIYASTPDYFDQKEVDLLTEVVDEISYALETHELEQKHRETVSALVESEQRYRLLFDNSFDAFLLTSPDGKIQSANPSTCRIFGRSEQEICAIGHEGIFDTSDPRLIKAVETRKETGYFYGELTGIKKDGTKFPIEVASTIFADKQDLFRTSLIIRDITARKQAEEEILQSKELFQIMFEQAPMGIALVDSVSGKILEANNKFASITGRSKAEITEIDWMSITHPDDIEEELRYMEQLNSGLIQGYRMDKRYIRSDNSFLWISLTIAQIRVKNEARPQHLKMIEDITERKSFEDRLRTLSYAVDQSPVSIVITDLHGNIEYVNPKFTQITGYTSEEAVGQNPRILKSGHTLPKEYHDLWETIFSKNVWHGEFQNLRKNKEVYYESATISPITDEDGNIVNFLAVKEDITERKRSEDLIKTLSAVVRQSPSMILITDKKGKIEFTNDEFANFMKYPPEEIVGRNPRIFNETHHTPESYKQMWDTLRSGKIFKTEFKNRKKDGTEFWENVIIFPLTGDNGEIKKYILLKENITEKKQLICDLIRAKEKAEESDELKSAFLANMSHEIRTPLNSIIGFSDLLLDPYFSPEQQIEFIQMIKNGGNNLLDIIENILDISRLEKGQVQITKLKLPVVSLLTDIYKEFLFKHSDRNIQLILSKPDNQRNVYIESDESRIRQILVNFLNNAYKFTEKGTIEIGCREEENEVHIYIKDTGIGVPPEFHEKIFERFRQIETSQTRKYGGNGLGLAISKQLADLLGAKIWMESEPGKGSVFYLSFDTVHSQVIN
ncbi:MAG: PAS domain S-box protein [Prolixibacteraceae bacterium]|jgi:hypothetical protein